MSADLGEPVTLGLSKAACLVLFDMLSKGYEEWRAKVTTDSDNQLLLIVAGELAVRRALWQLEGAVERTLVEVFAPDYVDLVEQSKRHLTAV